MFIYQKLSSSRNLENVHANLVRGRRKTLQLQLTAESLVSVNVMLAISPQILSATS